MSKALLAMLFVSGCGGWQRTDTAREVAFAGTMGVDWYQTDWIVRNNDEENPIMGSHGQNVSPEVYFPVTMALHLAIAAALPPKWRAGWQYLTIGAEGNMVFDNFCNKYQEK